jgi:hypothetical protein
MPGSVSRRTVVRSATLATALALAGSLAGCEDTPSASGPSGPSGGKSGQGSTDNSTPTRDPAELAALRSAAGSLQQLSSRYDAVLRRHPALRSRLGGPRALHTQHLARLRSLGGTPAPAKSAAKAVPAASATAVAELVATEQRLAVAHATAATQRSGAAARLLASIAASQTQIAVTLGRKAPAR